MEQATDKKSDLAPHMRNRFVILITCLSYLTLYFMKVLLYFDCLKSFIVIYCPNDSGIIESTFSTHAVARELCSVQSRLHKGYIKSVPCYKSIQKLGIPSQCGQKAETVYNGYLQDANEDYDVLEDSDRNRHRYCIEEAYKMACISQNIFEVCDEAAQNTFDELIVKSKALRRVCTQANIVELRTDFIDFLFIDEEDEDHLRTFFDF
ncbi:uncharacterized protein [Parasteatoda tepidariorum]|uniref:uncharacterized protein n=1 Tax=Parasteatoda tepidariorum TaxID=114398 RepID=UPI0039BC60F3